MAQLHRTAQPGQQVVLNGVAVHVFTIGPSVTLALPGDDLIFSVGSTATPSTGIPEQRTPPVGGQIVLGGKVLHTFKAGDTVALQVPGTDILFSVPAAPSPTPTPAPTPNPVPTPVPPVPSPSPSPSPEGQGVVRVTTGSGGITAKSNTRYISASGRATITASIGVKLTDGVSNVSFEGIDFVGTSNKGDGVYAIAKRVSGVTFTDCSFRRFKAGVTMHHPKLDNLPPLSEYARNIKFIGCRFIDMQGLGDKEGHGGYFSQVDGLSISNSLVDGAGFAKANRHIFTHGFYIQASCRRVAVTNGFFNRCESVGVQARGPLSRWNDPDNNDPGPVITGNVFDDCAIAVMVNGPRATVRDNIVAVGHVHDTKERHGWQAVYASCGKLWMSDNLRVTGKAVETPGFKMPAWSNNPRSDAEWGYRLPCAYAENARNVDALSVRVDLTPFVTQLRNGGDIAAVVLQAKAAVRRAAGQ